MKKFLLRLRASLDPTGFLNTIRTLGALLMANVAMQILLDTNVPFWRLLTLGIVAFIMLLITCFKWN
jgi:hypothetical protein